MPRHHSAVLHLELRAPRPVPPAATEVKRPVNQDASTDTPTRSKSAAASYRWIALLVLLAATVGGVLLYWRHAEIYPSTDNAYTGANIVRVASQVSGPVVRVYVKDDDKVATGDPLFDIDPTLYDAALRNARAQFDAAVSAAGTAADALKAAAQKLEDKRVALEDALGKYRDAKDAEKEGQPPSDQLSTALKAWHDALQAFDDAEGEFAKAQDNKLTVTTPTVQLRAASAQLDKATHDRVKTHVTSSANGWVSNVSLRPGTVVQAGTPAFAVIEDGNWWVDANFKETDLGRIEAGQKATVRLDMYPGVTLEGAVESISAGSGATFSVLPPENATGNWVKVTQRFPVRIRITSTPDPDKPLRSGSSATVTIDTTETAQGQK
ncbi:MAG TPA: HlyD family secretion protein [Rhizobiales bacterium]|nr:HlyD family secretion protein [Hyphomicrobiales bacterium]